MSPQWGGTPRSYGATRDDYMRLARQAVANGAPSLAASYVARARVANWRVVAMRAYIADMGDHRSHWLSVARGRRRGYGPLAAEYAVRRAHDCHESILRALGVR